jgi:hypothetical protein
MNCKRLEKIEDDKWRWLCRKEGMKMTKNMKRNICDNSPMCKEV